MREQIIEAMKKAAIKPNADDPDWFIVDMEAALDAALEVMMEPDEAMLSNTVDEKGTIRLLDFTSVEERDQPFLVPRFTWRAMLSTLKKDQP